MMINGNIQNYTWKIFAKKVWIAVLSLLLLSIACGSSSKIVTLNIREEDLINLLKESEFANNLELSNLLIERINLTENQLTLHLIHFVDNGKSVKGEINYSLSINNGILQANVIRSDFKGIKLQDEWIEEISDMILQSLMRELNKYGEQLLISEIKVLKNGLLLRIEIIPTPTSRIDY